MIVTTNNQHYTDIANAIRGKGVSGDFKPSEMASAIGNIPSGTPLPELTDPATPSDVMTGKEYINGDGEKRVGNRIDALKYATNYANAHNNALFYGSIFPEGSIVEVDFENMTHLNDMFHGAVNAKEIIIHNLKLLSLSSNLFYNCRETEIIDLDGVIIKRASNNYVFAGCILLKEIKAYFNLSDKTASGGEYYFNNAPKLEEIRFVENTLSVSYGSSRYGDNFNGCSELSSESLVSVSNCLKDGYTRTISLHATCVSKCMTIYGTYADKTRGSSSNAELTVAVDTTIYKSAVSSIYGDYTYTYDGANWTDGSSTVVDLSAYGVTLDGEPVANDTLTVELYHYFTADDTGDVSLTEFITDIKGWTLA